MRAMTNSGGNSFDTRSTLDCAGGRVTYFSLRKLAQAGVTDLDRLQVNATYQDVLSVPIRKVTIPVAAGRNLAVLVEAAVRNFVLNQRGIDSTKEFIERQQKLMEDGG